MIAEAYGGLRLMPAKGGKTYLSIEAFSGALVYMVNKSVADWTMPDEK